MSGGVRMPTARPEKMPRRARHHDLPRGARGAVVAAPRSPCCSPSAPASARAAVCAYPVAGRRRRLAAHPDLLPRHRARRAGRRARRRLAHRAATRARCARTPTATARASCPRGRSAPASASRSPARSTIAGAGRGLLVPGSRASRPTCRCARRRGARPRRARRACVTRPDLRPPAWDVHARARRHERRARSSPARSCSPPATARRARRSSPRDGRVRYWRPMPAGMKATDVRVQTYRGDPALTFWQGADARAARAAARA